MVKNGPEQMPRETGKPPKVNKSFHRGVATCGAHDNTEFILVASDTNTLEHFWNKIMRIPLNRGKVRRVVLFEEKS